MIKQFEIKLPTYSRGFHLITDVLLSQIPALPQQGIMHVFIKHTSAGLSINENADPSVRTDLETYFNKIVPEGSMYTHDQEGPDDMPAHIKAAMIGFDVSIPISNGKLNLGIWQGIYLCEFRNAVGARSIVVSIYS